MSDRGRWLSFVSGMWLLASTGLTYSFAIYSPALKSTLGYSQQQLGYVAVAKDIGNNVGLLAGYLFSALPPWANLLIGAVQVMFFMYLGVNSGTYYNTVTLVITVSNFPFSRGQAVGLLKGMVGLSAAIYSQFYAAIFAPDRANFLLLLCLGPAASAVGAMGWLRACPAAAPNPLQIEEEQSHFHFLFKLLLSLLSLLLTTTIAQTLVPYAPWATQAVTAGMLLLLVLPLWVPLRSAGGGGAGDRGWLKLKRKDSGLEEGGGGEEGEETGGEKGERETKHILPKGSDEPGSVNPPLDCTLLQALRRVDFWLVFLSMFCGAGTGLTVINNLAQIGEAVGVEDMRVAVALVSIWNCLGRVGGGFFSEYLIRTHGQSRLIVVAWAQALMVVGHLMLAFALPGSIPIGSLIIGFTYGVVFALLTASLSELFGITNFGMIYNVFTMANPLGSCVFSGLVAGRLYDIEAVKEAEWKRGPGGAEGWAGLAPSTGLGAAVGGGDRSCTGAHCFRLTLLIMAFVCVCGFVATYVLAWRTMGVYKSLYGKQEVVSVEHNNKLEAEK